MADEVLRIEGPDMRRIGAELRKAPDAMRREITREMRGPMTAVAARHRAAARALQGQRGVPPEWAKQAARDVRVDLVLTGQRPRAQIRVRRSSNGRGPWLLNEGEWEHPYYGDRRRWHEQRISRRGWFDETGRKERSKLITETTKELNRAADRLAVRIGR